MRHSTSRHCKTLFTSFLLLLCLSQQGLAQSSIQYVYDEVGRLIAVIDTSGDTATYTYDPVGNLLSIGRHSSSSISIIAFSPGAGSVGTTVTIAGTGFSATPSQNAVTFNGTSASVSSASATQLVVQVPTGATTGTIGVTAPSGSATSASSFSVTSAGAPTITSFTPSSGVAGTSISVTGTNFETVLANDKTRFNTSLVAPATASSTTLTALVPANTGSGHITIATPLGTAVSSGDLIIPPSPYVVADVATSGRIPFATATTVTVSTANKIGLMLFDGTVGQRVSVVGTNGISGQVALVCDVTVTMLSPSAGTASPVGCMEGSGFIDTVTLGATGTFTLLVDPASTATGSVTLTVYDVTDLTGTITAGGSAVTKTFTTPGQNGNLTFTGTAGQRISLNGTNGMAGQVGLMCDVNVTILKPDKSVLAPATCMEGSGFIDTTTLPLAGTYTITIDPTAAATGSLTLTLYDVPADATGSITAGGSAVTTSTSTPGQNASRTFSGTSGQRISLRGTNGTYTGTAFVCDVNVTILNPNGTVLAPATCMEGSGFADVRTLGTTGTYTIQTDPYLAATGSLTLQLYDVPADPTSSLTLNGAATTLTTTTPGQNATWTFSGTSGQQATVHVGTSSIGWVTVSLLKPDGTTLTSQLGFFGGWNLSTQTLPTTGTYTIKVDPDGTGTGSIAISVSSP